MLSAQTFYQDMNRRKVGEINLKISNFDIKLTDTPFIEGTLTSKLSCNEN